MYHKWQSYAVWFLRYGAWQTEFFVILDLFLPFYPPNNLKNQLLKKWKKHLDSIILQKCPKNHDYKLHCSWDTTCGGCNFYFSFCAIFCPFTSKTTQKIKVFLKNGNNAWKYHFTHVYQKLWSCHVRFFKHGA